MVDAIPIVPVPFPQQTTTIASTSASTPTEVYTVYKATQRVYWTGLTLSNTQTHGTTEQVWIGIRYQDSTGTSDWDPIFSVYLDGGEVFAWEGRILISAGDEIVAYGSTGSYVVCTPEMERAS